MREIPADHHLAQPGQMMSSGHLFVDRDENTFWDELGLGAGRELRE